MQPFSLTLCSDHALLRELAVHAQNDRGTTTLLLAHISEVHRRRLYRESGYSSMYRYLVHELRMSEDVAYKRIQAALAVRRFPAILPAIADGRLQLTGVVLLAPHMKRENADDLLAAATHKTNKAIRQLIAERFPQPDLPVLIQEIGACVSPPLASPIEGRRPESAPATATELDSNPVVPSNSANQPTPIEPLPTPPVAPVASVAPVAPVAPRASVAPLSPGRFAIQVTVDQETIDALARARELLGHSAPSRDLAAVLKQAALAYVQVLEKRKFAKCDRPRPQRVAARGRHVPAAVKRTVYERDGGRCTFVGANKNRCDERAGLELDHIQPVARGGQSTVDNLRLRCRAHNQLEAERTFGGGFMQGKREPTLGNAANARALPVPPCALHSAQPSARLLEAPSQ